MSDDKSKKGAPASGKKAIAGVALAVVVAGVTALALQRGGGGGGGTHGGGESAASHGPKWKKRDAGSASASGSGESADAPWSVPAEGCAPVVTKEELVQSVELGSRFLLAHQKPEGNFDYLYDWKTKAGSTEDNDVRQAGALWALALLYGYAGPPKAPATMKPALEKGLDFFDKRAREQPGGLRYPVYPGQGPDEEVGGMGTAALTTISIVDYVRALPPDAKAERELWSGKAKAYVDYLVKARQPDGLWYGKIRYDGGAPFGAHSSYSDGEALLALVTAMKYLGRDDLAPVVKASAAACHKTNVDDALRHERDSEVTKGFYQWSSMAFYELATSKLGSEAPYGDWLMSLADWILDVHKVLDKPKNTGYAYEGIVSAYAWANANGDKRAPKYACAIHRGLGALLGWQVGHPRAADLGTTDDPKAIGGVQNGKADSALRIDVTQHQMHATMLAIDYLFTAK